MRSLAADSRWLIPGHEDDDEGDDERRDERRASKTTTQSTADGRESRKKARNSFIIHQGHIMLSTWRVVWGIVSWCYWVRAASNTLASSTAITFGGVKFSPPVATALQRLGIHDKPSPIQSAAIPLICSGLSCIVHAPTGSGKTFAFALPALKRLAIPNEADNNGKVVIISPTEELALQVIYGNEKQLRHYSDMLLCGTLDQSRR